MRAEGPAHDAVKEILKKLMIFYIVNIINYINKYIILFYYCLIYIAF